MVIEWSLKVVKKRYGRRQRTIYLTLNENEKLEERANALGVTVNEIVRNLIWKGMTGKYLYDREEIENESKENRP